MNQLFRQVKKSLGVRMLNWVTQVTTNGHRGKIRVGILRGYSLTLPKLERFAYFTGAYEAHIVKYLQTNIQPGATVFDVGSHCGYLSMVISKLVAQDGQVLSFEPVQRNIVAFLQNISDNQISNVQLVQKAVSDTVGSVEFATYTGSSVIGHIASNYAAPDAVTISVESTTLDTCVYKDGFPAPSLIKIDVEGGEGPVLFGAERLLQEHNPIVIAEVWDDEDDFAPLISYMQKFGYSYQIMDGNLDLQADGVGDVIFFPE